jgi:hypothetical protein
LLHLFNKVSDIVVWFFLMQLVILTIWYRLPCPVSHAVWGSLVSSTPI